MFFFNFFNSHVNVSHSVCSKTLLLDYSAEVNGLMIASSLFLLLSYYVLFSVCMSIDSILS